MAINVQNIKPVQICTGFIFCTFLADTARYLDSIYSCISNFISGARVTDVSPDYGSLGGETRLTIYGGGELLWVPV